MTPEDKAKAYDKAIEKIRSGIQPLHDGSKISGVTKDFLEEVFPELKESEDERIRKAIIDFLWNEKIFLQEAHSSVDNNPKYRFVVDAITWLEKQGDKKHCDKIEPTFKVGDWVVGSNNVFQIISLNDELNCYIAVTPNDEEVKIPYYFNDGQGHMCSYHRWALSDAKAGDVLSFDDGTIVIFKDLYNETTFHSYCHIEDGVFDVSKNDMPDWWESEGFHPATKEQRDRFFAKMNEAGYEWNDVKREPKKIEDEPKLKEGNFYECIKSYHHLCGNEYWFDEGKVYFCEEDGYLRSSHNNLINVYDCKNWQSYFRPYTGKPTCCKEDEHRMNDAVYFLETAKKHYASTVEIDACIDWIKSLKQRLSR